MEYEEIIKTAYNKYIDSSKDEKEITILMNTFNDLEECKKDGNLNLELIDELNNRLLDMFIENGYKVYTNRTYAVVRK